MPQTTLHAQDLPKASQAPQSAQGTSRGDHAFPMLSANRLGFPPEFRFMWASR